MNVVVDLSMSILTENIQLQFRETVLCVQNMHLRVWFTSETTTHKASAIHANINLVWTGRPKVVSFQDPLQRAWEWDHYQKQQPSHDIKHESRPQALTLFLSLYPPSCGEELRRLVPTWQ